MGACNAAQMSSVRAQISDPSLTPNPKSGRQASASKLVKSGAQLCAIGAVGIRGALQFMGLHKWDQT